jgi:iron complex transport system substrate-binding protein
VARRSLQILTVALMAVMAFPFLASGTVSAQTAATPAAAPSPQLPVTVKDINGKDVTVKDISRIVPLSGDIAEIIYDLGLQKNVVGVDVSATYPPHAWDGLPQIGFERNLAAEGILALQPTVVIGKSTAGPAAVLDQIRAAGVPVVIINDPQDMTAPVAKIQAVAAALGVTDAGAALAKRTQSAIDAEIARAAAATSPKPTVMFLYVRTGVQLIGGAGSVADAVIAAAGGVDAGTKAGVKGFMPVSAELIAEAAPDYIIVPASGLDSIGGMSALLKIPGIADSPAAKAGHILAIDDEVLLGFTPRTNETIRDLANLLHPELAPATPVATPAS